MPRSLKLHNTWYFPISLRNNLNFFRIHVLFFTLVPLIAAAVFFASNGQTHVSFVDSLFVCVSAMTVTGLTTIDLSSITPWQQVLLFLLMYLGSPVTVSWFIVLVRRYFFAKKFERIIDSQLSSAGAAVDRSSGTKWLLGLLPWRMITLCSRDKPSLEKTPSLQLRPDMIRRVEVTPQRVNPSGLLARTDSALADLPSIQRHASVPRSTSPDELENHSGVNAVPGCTGRRRSSSFPRERKSEPVSPVSPTEAPRIHAGESVQHEPDQQMPRIPTHGSEHVVSHGSSGRISPSTVRRKRGSIRAPEAPTSYKQPRSPRSHEHGILDHTLRPSRTATMHSVRSTTRPVKLHSAEEDFGGFPSPHVVLMRLFRKFFPRLHQRLTRTVTIPSATVQSKRGGQTTLFGAKPVPYISFDAIVGRNSKFHGLTRENLEELGGVEYRALNMLLRILGFYHIGVPLVAFVIIAPYISQPRWTDVFRPPQQHRFISPVWYSLFQVISAYTNTGMSLVDQSMVPFQKAYPEVLTLPFVILVGNTAFPIFLRFVIWASTKFVSKDSRTHETLHFLLDHPRRCFIYLFPSHQTWFLLFVLFLLNFTDWFFFVILDIGNPAIKTIPLGTRVAIGLLQATAVRSAGFGTILLSALAPAVKVLYVVMMYVSVYPIAMSVRSTNVYEERSLGVYEDDLDEEPEDHVSGHGGHGRARIWGKYLASHARRQLSFDMWWLAFALFLVCIVERGPLQDENNAVWFNIFTIIFELTSAYGTVGLSLGIPSANYSFSGALQPLSKLIICAVMLRGRHRGLPVAIDRAVLLPAELWRRDQIEAANLSVRRSSPTGLRDAQEKDGETIQGQVSENNQTVGPEETDPSITKPSSLRSRES
ncbi:cation transport protein-domain-containing protein [Gautieria morchelliformis]|nr:cation transport protein-domain-containing protein [Gautieria morchelliformis]